MVKLPKSCSPCGSLSLVNSENVATRRSTIAFTSDDASEHEPGHERAAFAHLAPSAILVRLHFSRVIAFRIIRIATDRRAHAVADRGGEDVVLVVEALDRKSV